MHHKAKYVIWDEEEWRRIASAIVDIVEADPNAPMTFALERAQSTLPLSRQRQYATWVKCRDTLEPLMAAERRRRNPPPPPPKPAKKWHTFSDEDRAKAASARWKKRVDSGETRRIEPDEPVPFDPLALQKEQLLSKGEDINPTPNIMPMDMVRTAVEGVIENACKTFASRLAYEIASHMTTTVNNIVAPAVRTVVDEQVERLRKEMGAFTALQQNELERLVQEATKGVTQSVIINTPQEVPDGVESVKLAPRDRKPRVAVFGLIRQQREDIEREFGEVMDFVFIQDEVKGGSIDLKPRLQNCDVAMMMMKMSGHWMVDQCNRAGVRIIRVTGGVHMLKSWLQSWYNGTIAVTSTGDDSAGERLAN